MSRKEKITMKKQIFYQKMFAFFIFRDIIKHILYQLFYSKKLNQKIRSILKILKLKIKMKKLNIGGGKENKK